ncbi:MAG TPA: L,D-transpeptidase [Ktedonobacteraceae bacterium]|nr:L,D-transpeptidase [Ktedonobacteraceae bacterium]
MVPRSQQLLRQRNIFVVLACMLLGGLLLGACSSPASANSSGSTSTPVATPTVSPTLLEEGDTQLQSFQQWIALMQQYGGNVTTYQQQYNSDRQALAKANTDGTYSAALKTLQEQVDAIKIPAMKQECTYLQQELEQQVSAWGKQHTYYDSYNNTTYALGYEYDSNTGIGGPLWLQEELSSDQTLADYQQTVEDLNMWLYNFQQMKADFTDKTPANQPHQADLNLLQHYGYMNERVVVVSLDEEELRAYDHGKLVNAFPVTTGQPDLPSPPGTWWIEGKKHPTVFKSTAPKGSPDWYPDTPITWAMQYHSNGYFLHEAWWRTEFGPGTNFPHQDPDGDPFAGQGSHGCVNMSTNDAGWLYGFVSLFTPVVIY